MKERNFKFRKSYAEVIRVMDDKQAGRFIKAQSHNFSACHSQLHYAVSKIGIRKLPLLVFVYLPFICRRLYTKQQRQNYQNNAYRENQFVFLSLYYISSPL